MGIFAFFVSILLPTEQHKTLRPKCRVQLEMLRSVSTNFLFSVYAAC